MIDVTAIIPTRNDGPLLGEAIASALDQDPEFRQIIVVDDAGHGDAALQVEAFGQGSRLRYLRLDRRRGPGGARNAGLNAAQGEFVQFIDADDRLLPGATRAFAAAARAAGALDLYCFSATAAPEPALALAVDRYHRPFDRWFESGLDALDAMLRRGRHLASPCLYVLRRAVVDLAPETRFPEILHEDEVFTPELFRKCGLTRVERKSLYVRRLRKGSITTSVPTVERIDGRLRAHAYWRQFARCDGLARWPARALYANRLLNAARHDARHLDPEVVMTVFQRFGMKVRP